MKVFLDLNVVLDVVLNRQPWVEESQRVWDANQSRTIDGYLAATGLTNLFYIGAAWQIGIGPARRLEHVWRRLSSLPSINKR